MATYTVDDARDLAAERMPYYRVALSRLRLVEDRTIPTMATSKAWVTHYNPDTLAKWTIDETAAVLVHELEHLLRRHSERCKDRDHKRFNVAGDAEINQRLPNLPAGVIYPETLGAPRGRTAETYYGFTSGDDGNDAPQDGSGDPQSGDGAGQGSGDPQSGDGAGQGSGDPQSGDGAGQGSGDPQSGDGPSCGSAAGGELQSNEQNDVNPDVPDKATADDIRRQTAKEVRDAIGWGDNNATDLRDWAEAELQIDRAGWYTALAGAVGHTLQNYGAPTRWLWPGRRDPRDVGGAVLPRWTGERPKCAVVIDTSGSIGPEDLGMARAAATYIARVADVTFYGCNTMATRYGSQLPERIIGGGGTYLPNGIRMAEDDGARLIVVITDCITDWPSTVSVPVIIGANASARAWKSGIPREYTVLPIRADQDVRTLQAP
jgi:predicted metal-dependent peptidase